jgi:hypothetical protein
MCFKNPESANTLLQVAIPAAVTALITHFGVKAVAIAKTDKKDSK